MKLTLNPSSNCLATASSVALVCLYLLSCGLGTEVGNGAKETGTTGEKKTQASNESESGNDGGPESNGEEKSTSEDQSPLDAALGGVDYGIDLAILFNSCGSPFETIYDFDTIVLKGTPKNGTSQKLTAVYDINKSLKFSDSKNKGLLDIADDETKDDYSVVVTKKDGSEFPSAYLCSNVVEEGNNGYHNYSVTLTPKDSQGNANASKPTSTLVWSVDKTQSNRKLVWIKVSTDDVELLKLETDPE